MALITSSSTTKADHAHHGKDHLALQHPPCPATATHDLTPPTTEKGCSHFDALDFENHPTLSATQHVWYGYNVFVVDDFDMRGRACRLPKSGQRAPYGAPVAEHDGCYAL
jgi:hypothetical protein